MKTYIFEVEIEQEEDGRWSAVVPALPGCASWGYSKEEALENIKEETQAYLLDLAEEGQPLPEEAEKVKIMSAPAITVTL